jgi:hypothetical protein
MSKTQTKRFDKPQDRTGQNALQRLDDIMTKQTRIGYASAAALLLAAAAPAAAFAQAMPAATQPAQAAPADTNQGPAIAGFRSANFGMTEAQVKETIAKDFNLPASAIQAGENAIQHTDVLNVAVPNLMPGGGTANVAYVFGYQSHKLIAVNILWSKATDPKVTAQQLYQNGESLQQYFAGEGFPAQRSTGNVALPSGILLFRATDPTNNAVLLVLSGNLVKDPKNQDKTAMEPQALSLAYAQDPQHADVYHLNKGSF